MNKYWVNKLHGTMQAQLKEVLGEDQSIRPALKAFSKGAIRKGPISWLRCLSVDNSNRVAALLELY